MTNRPAETSPLIVARVAGLLYLVMGMIGAFSILYVPSTLIVPGDAATTANNIMASEMLFRSGIVSGLLTQIVLFCWFYSYTGCSNQLTTILLS